MIDYSAIREWAAVPFRPKGQGIILDEEAEKLKREGITDDAEGKKGSGMLWERADQIDKDGDSRVAELSSGSNVSDYPAEDCDDDKDDNQAYTVPVDDVDVTTSSSNSFEGDGDASDSCPSSSSQFNGPSLKLISASVPLDSFAADCEDAHTVCEGMGLGSGLGPLPPSFTLPPRILDRSSDSSSSSTFKPATSGQSVIHSSPNSALLNLLDDDASVLMQRHHVLISSGRSSPTIGAFECQIVQPIAVDPMSASVLRYLSGGLVGMEGSSEDKIDFDNDADVEVEWESGHDDCQHRPPPLSLFSSMEDLRSLDALESFLNVSSNDPFEGEVQVLDRSTRNRVGSAREQRGYSL